MTYQITSIPSVFGFNDLGTGTVYGSRVYTGRPTGAQQPRTPRGHEPVHNPRCRRHLRYRFQYDIRHRRPHHHVGRKVRPASSLSIPLGIASCPNCIVELQVTTAPVPEPATYGLVAAGFAGLLFLRRPVRRTTKYPGR